VNFLTLFARNLRDGPYTEPFPFAPAPAPKRLRGRISFDAPTCEGCRICEEMCPSGAIRFEKTADGLGFACWHNSCVFCGNCAFYCPTGSIWQTDDWHLAHTQDEKFAMVEFGLIPNQTCAECGAKALATMPAVRRAKPPLADEEIGRLKQLCPRCRAKFMKARRPNP